MVKIKMHALYDHFPEHNPLPGEKYIDCFSDHKIRECVQGSRTNIAMLFEPRSLMGDAYDYVMQHHDYFRYIFTHDSKLLRLPNAYMLNWADVWLWANAQKTKGISIVTSPKNWCPLHKARLELYNYYKLHPGVDIFFGDWGNPEIPNISVHDYLANYKFSIVIENDIDEFWFTEKILNCFSTKTVPIYVGATKISEIFNGDGIIQVDNWRDIPSVIEAMYKIGLDNEYAARQQSIDDNYERAGAWDIHWKRRFFDTYEPMLEELLNE